TITSLRHEWTHPAFKVEVESLTVPLSKAWLEHFAGEAGVSYDELMEGADHYLRYGEYMIQGGRWEGFSTPLEFWNHYQMVAGRVIEEAERGNFFSCSC